MIKCVLFDLDGTLVDSYDSIVEAFKESFKFLKDKNCKIPYKKDEEIKKLIGIPHTVTFKKFCNDDKIVKTAADIFREKRMSFKVSLINGTIETLKFLKEKNIKIGIITTTGKELTNKILSDCKIDNFFNVIITRDDVNSPKPNPEPIIKAIEILNMKEINLKEKIKKQECIMVGDHPNDILCAKNAEIKSIGLINSHSYDELKNSGADYIIKDLRELKNLI